MCTTISRSAENMFDWRRRKCSTERLENSHAYLEKKFDVFNPGIYCMFNVCIPIIVL